MEAVVLLGLARFLDLWSAIADPLMSGKSFFSCKFYKG